MKHSESFYHQTHNRFNHPKISFYVHLIVCVQETTMCLVLSSKGLNLNSHFYCIHSKTFQRVSSSKIIQVIPGCVLFFWVPGFCGCEWIWVDWPSAVSMWCIIIITREKGHFLRRGGDCELGSAGKIGVLSQFESVPVNCKSFSNQVWLLSSPIWIRSLFF